MSHPKKKKSPDSCVFFFYRTFLPNSSQVDPFFLPFVRPQPNTTTEMLTTSDTRSRSKTIFKSIYLGRLATNERLFYEAIKKRIFFTWAHFQRAIFAFHTLVWLAKIAWPWKEEKRGKLWGKNSPDQTLLSSSSISRGEGGGNPPTLRRLNFVRSSGHAAFKVRFFFLCWWRD